MKRSFVQAKHYHRGRRGLNGDGRVHGVVVHSMEAPEKGSTAESVAHYFTVIDRTASADKCFDNDSMVQCVKDGDEAYHAPPCSRYTLGYEHAGYARQSAADWHDPYSWAMLRNSASELAADAAKHKFPLVIVTKEALARGTRDGVWRHADCSALPGASDHWDPGEGFPLVEWVDMARNGLHAVAPPPAQDTLELGDRGTAVHFAQTMLNILHGYRINANGHRGGAHLDIPKDPKKAAFGPKTQEAVREFQRFTVAMWEMAGKKGTKPSVSGVIDPATAGYMAYWVPKALKKT